MPGGVYAAIRFNGIASDDGARKVGRCRLTVSKPELKAPWYHRLKLEYDEPLSNFPFNFDLRRYTKAETELNAALQAAGLTRAPGAAASLAQYNDPFTNPLVRRNEVGQCRLTPSNPR